MTTQKTTKIRLVRCPKCRQLLPEPDIPVYKCGGCGAVLQAKKRKTDSTGLSRDGTDANKITEQICVPDQKEISLNQQETTSYAGGESSLDTSNNRNQDDFPNCNGKQPEGGSSPDTSNHRNQDDFPDCNGKQSEGGSSPDTRNNRNQDDFPDCNGKQPGDKNLSLGLPSSTQLRSQENEDLLPSVSEKIEQAQREYNSDQDTHGYENEFGDSKGNCNRDKSFSDDFNSSMKLPCNETEDSNTTSDHCARVNQIARDDCNRELHEDTNFLSKVSSLTEDKLYKNHFSPKGGAVEARDESNCILQLVDSSTERKFEGNGREFPNNGNSSQEISSSTVLVPEKPSSVLEANSEVEENLGDHVLCGLNTEYSLDKKETDSSENDENPRDETIPSDNVESPDYQQLRASQRMIPRGFGHATSEDTLDNLPLVNLSSKLGLKNINLSKSPTGSYYGNDDSASSYDGFENRIPGRSSKPPKRKLKHANFNNTNRLQREDGPPANDVPSSNLEIQDQAIIGSASEVRNQARKSSILPEKNYPTMKYKNHQDDLHDLRNHGHSSGSRIIGDKDEHVSKLPFFQKYSLADHRKGNPSHYPNNVFQHYSGFCAPDAPSYTEPDKLELLRMVYELKDELNRMQISNVRFPPPVIREDKYTPLFYDRQLAPLEGISANLCYSRYPEIHGKRKGLPKLHRVPRVAFSGDAADYRRHVDCACLHCHTQDWQCPVQLPSHSICCNKVHCPAHSSPCHNGQCSTSSSPQHYKSSEFSVWDHETMSDDQRHRDNDMKKLRLRERYHSAKRLLRPVAGGTPIVSCYHCSQLLQLPADFLLLGRRCHKLRCNACRKVMKFLLHSSTHLVPRMADGVAPPPSMVDDCSESIRQRNWPSTSHSNDNPYAEPLSFTDDYGLSLDRSYSTEGR
ncbi:hypothetical protein ACH5RR_019479 [Cinchona calisaya]|uniref:Zinc-ribbon domain-containing protein n=1 Tax=Cinchona calisaya TaxID=153742 RepID=A0ABD2ZPG3_9GENT